MLDGIRDALATRTEITVHNATRDEHYATRQNFSERQIDMLLAGGLISWLQERSAVEARDHDAGSPTGRTTGESGQTAESGDKKPHSTPDTVI